MAAGRLFVPNYFPAEDANGDRIAGAKLYFYDYDAGPTTDLKAVYTSSALTTMLSNPVVADSVGVFPAIWADTTEAFTVAVTDADGAPLDTYDNVSPSIDATLASVALAESAADAAEAAQAAAEAAQSQAEAIVADVSGEPFTATSATSISLTTGEKALTLNEDGKLYSPGQTVVVAYTTLPKNHGTGTVISLNEITNVLTVDLASVTTPDGAGPYALWSISLSSEGGVLSVAGETGVVTATDLKAALAVASTDITDFDTAVNNLAIAAAVAL